jgi:hypothetical protein
MLQPEGRATKKADETVCPTLQHKRLHHGGAGLLSDLMSGPFRPC